MTGAWSNWSDANHSYLVTQFTRLKALLRGEPDGIVPGDRAEAEPPAIDVLSACFSLTAFERDLLLLCAGVEMDSEIASLCGQGVSGRPVATFGLALATLPNAHWSALAPVRPLRRWRLVEVSEEAVLAGAQLRIDERVLHYLAGINYLDPRLSPLLTRVDEPALMAAAQEAIAKEIAAALNESPLPVVNLPGNDLDGKRDVAAVTAALCGMKLHSIAETGLPSSPHELEALVSLWEREAALLESALLIECTADPAAALVFAERAGTLIFAASPEGLSLDRPDLRFRIDRPTRRDQLLLWRSASGAEPPAGLETLVSEFSLSAREIYRVGRRLQQETNTAAALWQACRSLKRTRLDGLAQHIEPAASWDDLILPEPQRLMLLEIASHVRHRLTVYDAWGFEGKSKRGLGISALFAGESGTGKTMAAEVLACELNLDLYRIDLSSVVSKYIGETEKNLGRVFDAAEVGGTILLFDEADALFGKRSEVKDSHDRYANIEVSYLLQRMESCRGLSILTTNQKDALDGAFQRRLRFVIHFPFPDFPERAEIWRRVFPEDTPTSDLDYKKLARLHMAGGHIRNIALNAAFQAAETGGAVEMKHLYSAAHAEASRAERGLTDAETRGWI